MKISMFTDWLLYSSATAGILVLIILSIKAICKSKLGPKGQYYIWFLIFIKLLVPFSLHSHASIFNLFPSDEGKLHLSLEKTVTEERAFPHPGLEKKENTLKTIVPSTSEELNSKKPDNVTASVTPKSENTSEKTAEIPMGTVIILVWSLGALITGFFILSRDILFWIKINKNHPERNTVLDEIIAECTGILQFKRHIAAVVTSDVSVPAVYGIIKPRLLFPQNINDQLGRNEIKYIVLHELAHVKRQDIPVNCIITLLKIMHWFNPLIWLAFSKMKYDMEVACDAAALQHLKPGEYTDYGFTIIKLLKNINQMRSISTAAGIIDKKSHMEGRINMICLFKKNSYKWSAAALALITAVGVIGLTVPIEAAPLNNTPVKSVEASYTPKASAASTAEGKIINFPDKKLAECIARDSHLPAGSVIREGDLRELKHLKLLEVYNLEGIQSCTNLESLNFEKCSVRDISPLQKLSKLKDLIIQGNTVNLDLKPLADIQQLESLRLDEVKNFEIFKGLKELKSLTIESMDGISDLKDLKLCKSLESLSIRNSGEGFKSIEGIEELPNLKELSIDFAEWNTHQKGLKSFQFDISPISKLTDLQSLTVTNVSDMDSLKVISNLTDLNKLSIGVNKASFNPKIISNLTHLKELCLSDLSTDNLNDLSGMTELEALSIFGSKFKDISAISKFTKLKLLTLNDNQIADIQPLSELKGLNSLDLSYNKVSNISALTELNNLKELDISGNSITNLKSLHSLSSLESLYASQCGISDISPLSGLKNLKRLEIGDNKISDISSISSLSSLEELNITYNRVRNISDLKELQNLKYFYASSNNITDIRFLSNLKELINIQLGNNSISDLAPLAGLKTLTVLNIENNKITDVKPLKGLTNLSGLYLKGNNIKDLSPLAPIYDNLFRKDFKLN